MCWLLTSHILEEPHVLLCLLLTSHTLERPQVLLCLLLAFRKLYKLFECINVDWCRELIQLMTACHFIFASGLYLFQTPGYKNLVSRGKHPYKYIRQDNVIRVASRLSSLHVDAPLAVAVDDDIDYQISLNQGSNVTIFVVVTFSNNDTKRFSLETGIHLHWNFSCIIDIHWNFSCIIDILDREHKRELNFIIWTSHVTSRVSFHI